MDIVNINDQTISISTTNEIIDINVIDQIIDVNVTNEIVNVQVQNGAYPLPNNVYSVFGRVGNVVGQAGDYNTDLVGEGLLNKYYTDARSRAAISENITGIDYSSASGIFSLASGYVIPTQAMLDAKADDSTTITIDGVTQNIGSNRTWQVLPIDGTTGQILAKASNTNYDTTWIDNYTSVLKHEVKAGEAISKGQAVYVSSADGTNMIVSKSSNATEATSSKTMGLLAQDLALNGKGYVITEGLLAGLNTATANAGDPVWLGTGGNLLFGLANKPSAPAHLVFIGIVTRANTNNGEIFVKVQNGFEMGELHDYAASGVANNDVITYESATSLYKPKSIDTILGYTPANSARLINTTAPLTGGGDLSADRTLAITQAGVSTNGYLSTTDWNTFNNKQPLITAGTTAQYYRGDKTFQTLNTAAVPESTNLYYTQARFDSAFGAKSTTNLTEGTNLYFTNARAQSAISGTLPISVVSGVVSISQAGGASNGYLSSTDWNTFNNKQAALSGTGFVKSTAGVISYDTNTYLTTINGIAAGGELSGTYANPSLVNSAVTGKVLTGLNLTGGGTIADTDTILGAFGKVQNQISALVGGVMYQGTWNASTNTPSITSSVGTKGHYYIVATAGSTNINGITDWKVGDWIIFNGSTWDKVDNTDAVSSVNGYTGAVSLVTSDVAESGNLYFTNARAIGSTLTGYTSGAGVVASTDTILQAIQKLNGNIGALVTGVSSVFGRTGAVVAASGDYTTTQVTEGTNLYYTQARFDTAFSGKSTTNLAEGTNLYYTAARFNTAFAAKSTTDLAEGTNKYYTDARVSANTDVAANTAARHSALTLGVNQNGLSLADQVLSLGLASSTTNGALSSTDWSTFNAKQNALTNPVTGTGTNGYIPKFTGASTLGNSIISESASTISIAGILSANKVILSLGADQAELTSAFNNDFKLTNSGNFRIVNNTNTSALLTITNTGFATFANDIFTYAGGGIFFNGGGSYSSGIFQNVNGLNLQTGSTPRLTINSTGNILVNTTTDSTAGFNKVLVIANDYLPALELRKSGTIGGARTYNLAVGNTGGFSIYDATAALDRFVIDSDATTRIKIASDRGLRFKASTSSYAEIAGYQVFTENIRELRVTGSTLQFYTGDGSNSTGSESMRISESGVIGIGVTPITTTGTTKTLHLGGSTILQSPVYNQTLLADNAYYSGSGWKYVTNNNAAGIRIGALAVGEFTFHSAPYATAGSNIPNWDTTDIKMKITPSGQVTMPYQPSFYATSTAGSSTYGSSEVIVFNSTRHNTGSHYNTSNGRFTAPVAGKYLFTLNVYNYGGYTNSIVLTINGSQYVVQDVQPLSYAGNVGSITTGFTIIWDLAAGDYVEPRVRAGGSAQIYRAHSHFSGCLLS